MKHQVSDEEKSLIRLYGQSHISIRKYRKLPRYKRKKWYLDLLQADYYTYMRESF